ncbi:MAG: TlpA family protein disulfide reductase [Bacteroidales bacterium]|jgi:thiol-disulfide isomerase/thioredoxin|nr:TlpA family protein disulfide reductase [Bacteroidales bacterium]
MKQKLLVIALCICIAIQGFSQIINLDFPKLSGNEAWIYTFTGNHVDSTQVILDKNGKAIYTLPHNNYKGIAYVYVPQKGGGELIIAEKQVAIHCADERFNANSLVFPQSEENMFLRYIFERKNFLTQKQEWLKAGSLFIEAKSPFAATLHTLQNENTLAIKQFNDSVKQSTLYAAQYSQLTDFMQKLYATVQKPDRTQFEELKNEMERTLPIEALYHAGNLWINVHNYYPGLFVTNVTQDAQEAYAQSIIVTMQRLQEPVFTKFFLSAINACERSNLQIAIDKLSTYMIENHPARVEGDFQLRRLQQANNVKQGSKAPEIAGLKTPLNQAALVIFFESDCGHCKHELEELGKNAPLFQSKGYRIISIAADVDAANYKAVAQNFKWNKDDQLCDFKGFDGENFKRFAVGATPTIFLISTEGNIVGKYAQVAEIVGKLSEPGF